MTLTGTLMTAADLDTEYRAAFTARMAAQIDALVERQARALGYKSASACAGYRDSTVALWAAEAQAFIGWRDSVWLAAFALQDQYAGAVPVPDPDVLLAQLPVWPEGTAPE